jgi:flagellar motor switch protein FliG
MSRTLGATEEVSGLRKAAILLIQIGQDNANRVLSQMRETEVEELVAEIMRLQRVDADTADSVVDEFHNLISARGFVSQGGVGFARELLETGLGVEKAGEILSRLEAAITEMPFQFMRRADPRQLLSFLQDEHPQTIALVLAHLPSDQASGVLSGFAPELQTDVAHRIAVMDRTSPDAVRRVESVLERRMSSILQPTETTTVGGVQPLIDIINRADRTTERLILESLETLDPTLAEEVRSRMFLFEDIVTLDDKSVQTVLRQVETNDLATALKGVRADVRDKVMKNLSERASETLAEEIEMLGPVRLRSVEEAQAKVVQVIRQLEESGQVVVSRGGNDEFVT